MITIGLIPRKTKGFFKGLTGHFSHGAFGHFWGLVLAMTISHGATIERLAKLLRRSNTVGGDGWGQFPAILAHIHANMKKLPITAAIISQASAATCK